MFPWAGQGAYSLAQEEEAEEAEEAEEEEADSEDDEANQAEFSKEQIAARDKAATKKVQLKQVRQISKNSHRRVKIMIGTKEKIRRDRMK